MGMMQELDAKGIRWKTLEDEFDHEKFSLTVEEGKDPDGTQLSTDMPRWKMSDGDIADLELGLPPDEEQEARDRLAELRGGG
jgi:hypothetical protein